MATLWLNRPSGADSVKIILIQKGLGEETVWVLEDGTSADQSEEGQETEQGQDQGAVREENILGGQWAT